MHAADADGRERKQRQNQRRQRGDDQARERANARETRERATRANAIARADVTSDASQWCPTSNAIKMDQNAPLDRPGDLHRRERRRVVMAEHRAVDHEDERLQERVSDRGQRKRAHLTRRTIRSLKRRDRGSDGGASMLAASAAQCGQ